MKSQYQPHFADGKYPDEIVELKTDPKLIVQLLMKQPNLSKYQHRIDKDNRKQDNIDNVKRMLASPVYGGSVLSKRVDGKRNSLKKVML